MVAQVLQSGRSDNPKDWDKKFGKHKTIFDQLSRLERIHNDLANKSKPDKEYRSRRIEGDEKRAHRSKQDAEATIAAAVALGIHDPRQHSDRAGV